MNQFTLVGNVACDGQQRFTTEGKPIGEYFLEDQEGNPYKVVLFGKAAEGIAQLETGQGVCVTGEIKVHGKEHGYATEFIGSSHSWLGALVDNTVIAVASAAGNVGRDPDIRYFESGSVLATWSMATRDRMGKTQWINCEAWSKTAETVANYVRKGSYIAAKGRLKWDSWKDRQSGETRRKLVLNVESFSFGPRGESNGAQANEGEYADMAF